MISLRQIWKLYLIGVILENTGIVTYKIVASKVTNEVERGLTACYSNAGIFVLIH